MEWATWSDQSLQNVCTFRSKAQPLDRARTLLWGLVGTHHVSPRGAMQGCPMLGSNRSVPSPRGAAALTADGDVQGCAHVRIEMSEDGDTQGWGCVEMGRCGNGGVQG